MRISESDRTAIIDLMDEMCAKLMEIGCDSVQILASAPFEGNMWANFQRGRGNLYARRGLVDSWSEEQRAYTLSCEIAESLRDEE